MEYLLGSIITILSFMLGWYMGQNKDKDIQTITKDIKKKVQLTDKYVGVVNRPTQEQIDKKKDPYLKTIEEGKNEMRELLKNLPIDDASTHT